MTAAAERLRPRTAENRMVFADGARGCMILLMLIGHADPPKLLFKLIYGFHMPFFFLLSGYLYNAEKYARTPFLSYCKLRYKSYVVPYFLYAFCNLLVNIPIELRQGITGKALLTSTAKHVFWIVYAIGDKAKTPNCTPLWYLPCLFLCCLLFYGLQCIPKESVRWVVCAVFCGAAFWLSEANAPQLPWHIDTALLGTVYMQIGLAARKLRFPQRVPLPFLIAGIAAALGFFCIDKNGLIDLNSMALQNIALTLAGSLLVCAAVFILFYKLYRGKALAWLGRNTMPVFAFNYAVNAYLRWIWEIAFPGRALSWWLLALLDVPCLVGLALLQNAVQSRLRQKRKPKTPLPADAH